MVKITIIDIDLGDSVEEIINNDVKRLTEKNQTEIDQALADHKIAAQAKQEKSEKQKLEKQSQDKALIACKQAYELLLANHKQNLTTAMSALITITESAIASPTSLIMRLKSYIKNFQDNKYVLKKCQRNNETHYELLEYNIGDDEA